MFINKQKGCDLNYFTSLFCYIRTVYKNGFGQNVFCVIYTKYTYIIIQYHKSNTNSYFAYFWALNQLGNIDVRFHELFALMFSF